MFSQIDPYNLERFVAAQAPVFSRVLSELKAGLKMGHWMSTFMLISETNRGLDGKSPVSIEYALSGRGRRQTA